MRTWQETSKRSLSVLDARALTKSERIALRRAGFDVPPGEAWEIHWAHWQQRQDARKNWQGGTPLTASEQAWSDYWAAPNDAKPDVPQVARDARKV